MDILTILLIMALGFSLAAPIGPVNIEMLKQILSKRKGFFFGVFTGFGATSADFIIAFIVISLGAEFLVQYIMIAWLKVLLFLFNVAILGYIGISSLQVKEEEISLNDENTMSLEQSEIRDLGVQYLKGFGIVVTSPWSYLWWISFGSYLLGRGIALNTPIERIWTAIAFISGILTWVFLFCSSISWSKKLANQKVLVLITKISAWLIIGFALKILYDAIICLITCF